MNINDLIVVLQTSMATCVLISGVGLLVLSMTNRLGRPLDRIRALTVDLKRAEGEHGRVLLEEVDILYRRAKLLQAAVTFSVLSIFFVATIILSLFVTATFVAGLEGLIGEEQLARKAALVESRLKEGRLILYAFAPQCRR